MKGLKDTFKDFSQKGGKYNIKTMQRCPITNLQEFQEKNKSENIQEEIIEEQIEGNFLELQNMYFQIDDAH